MAIQRNSRINYRKAKGAKGAGLWFFQQTDACNPMTAIINPYTQTNNSQTVKLVTGMGGKME